MFHKIDLFKIKFLFIILILTYNSLSKINAQDISNINEFKRIETRWFLCGSYSDTDSTFSTRMLMRNQDATFGKKLVRGLGLSFGYNLTMGAFLLTMPESISRWDRANKLKWSHMKMKMKEALTLQPVIDDDLWYINYVGHPYQGGYYFNNLRSQGAGFWESAAYGLAQSMIWEYIVEGWFERPSIQDMIVTPLAGALVGELSHKATLQMQKNGFSLSEKIIVTLINPSWTINNGFKTKKKIQYFGL